MKPTEEDFKAAIRMMRAYCLAQWKKVPKADGRRLMRYKAESEDKETVMSIPNFDADIFFECTGIRV